MVIFFFMWIAATIMNHFPRLVDYKLCLLCWISALCTVFFFSLNTAVKPVDMEEPDTRFMIDQSLDSDVLDKIVAIIKAKCPEIVNIGIAMGLIMGLLDMVWRAFYGGYYVIMHIKPDRTLFQFGTTFVLGIFFFVSTFFVGQSFRFLFKKNKKSSWITIYYE